MNWHEVGGIAKARKRETRSSQFKSKVALVAVTERQAMAEVVQMFGVNATLVHAWKQLLPILSGILENLNNQ